MGISKTEINLRRLVAASPHQLNQPKLVHYVATLREQLEQLAEEKTSDGLPRVSNAQVNDYSVKIEAIASKLAAHLSAMQEFRQPLAVISVEESISKAGGENPIPTSPRLRRRCVKLQDDLTDEMVGLAQQLKESSLVMTRSLKNTEKILDSTEKAVEHSLASTGHANSRALEVYLMSFTTTCFTWLVIFVMTCIFLMVVLLIRVT